MLRKWMTFLTAVMIGLVLAAIAISPPAPQSADTPLGQFSSARAMVDVRLIADEPHPTGSEELAKVRGLLVDRLTTLGLDTQVTNAPVPERALARLNRWSGANKSEETLYNVIGTLKGQDRSGPAVLLMAHYDTVWGSPGAADDTIGIAAILEIVRALKDDGQQPRDLIVLFTDAEEIGLSGARHFFGNNPMRDDIGAVINFEARGGGGTANLFQTSKDNGDAARLYARAVKQPSASSLSTFIYNILPNDTDLTPALELDYVAYNIANIGKAEYYHSPKISADALRETTLQHMGSQGLDLTRALLSNEPLPAKSADVVFFDLFGFFTVIYGTIWGWIILGLAGIFLILTVDRAAKKRDMITGAARMIGFLVVGGAVLYTLNILSGGDSTADYYDRLAAIPKLEIMATLTCVALGLIMFGQKPLSQNERIGATIPLFLMAFAGQFFAPTATYFLPLTMLLCAIGGYVLGRWDGRKLGIWLSAAFAALITGYMVALGHLLMLGVGPNLPSAVILPAALTVLALLPLYKGMPKRASMNSAIGVLMFAVVTAMWIRIDPIAATVPLY